MIIKHKKIEGMTRLRPLFLLSHFATIFISVTPFCHKCFLLSSFIKVSCNESIFIDKLSMMAAK